jgi:hypothetical protein
MNRSILLARTAMSLALSLCLAACGSASDAGDTRVAVNDATAAPPALASADEDAMVDEVVATLQACSYDGEPVRVAAHGLGAGVPSDCRDMVAQIMRFTGLPQNFTVVEAPVPNAAAVILLDEQKIPQRVIAFNKDFIGLVKRATGGNAWAPVSVMAHEIGHHLSGHTITPGGSQPPTELEADKFSGFVLYKMGATLDDAQKAMATLVADGPDGPTHPGRGRRLRAIADGWEQACAQTGADECASGLGVAANAPAPVSPAAAPAPVALPAAPVAAPAVAPAAPVATASAAAGVDTLPAPGSTPSKFDRFIYDEYGVLDTAWRAKFEQTMFDHARRHGVEIVTLLVKDLHGLSGDDYAAAMLRQLRVGKLDVGNGAVLVVAPDANEVGIAMGPGVALQMEYHDKKQSLQRWLQGAWTQCSKKRNCGNWTENFMLASDHIRRDTDDIEWTIRYQSLAELLAAYDAAREAREQGGTRYLPKDDPGYQKIARVEGRIVSLAPPAGDKAAWVNTRLVERGYKAVHVRTPDGYTVMLYVDPRTEALMPAGALAEGAAYSFIARVNSLSWNPKDTQSFDLLSYDLRG